VGAMSVTRHGPATAPTRAELAQFLDPGLTGDAGG
jgi:hypothetical protein